MVCVQLWHMFILLAIVLITPSDQVQFTTRDDTQIFTYDDLPHMTTTENHHRSRSPRIDGCTRDTMIIDKLLNGTGYNKYRLPDDYGVEVAVEFWVQAITEISEITNDFEMDIYINEMWMDASLNFEHMNPCKENLSMNHQVLDRLWSPNSCFINSKIAHIHDSPFRNVFLMLYPNGTVWVNYRVRVKGPCEMDLANFPMDVQTCSLVYESFNYNNQEVRMRWNPGNPSPVYPIGTIVLPDYTLEKIDPIRKEEKYPAGMWDELHVTFTFKRRFAYYFMQAYVPTYFVIFISWVSFALGSNAMPARTMLGVNSLLTMIFQFSSIMRNLPRVSYVKAIDIWMLGSMTFIFASLLELAIVGYKVKDGKATTRRPAPPPPLLRRPDPVPSPKGSTCFENRFMFPVEVIECSWRTSKVKFRLPNMTPDQIDKISIAGFPAAFAIFNIVYWSYYLAQIV